MSSILGARFIVSMWTVYLRVESDWYRTFKTDTDFCWFKANLADQQIFFSFRQTKPIKNSPKVVMCSYFWVLAKMIWRCTWEMFLRQKQSCHRNLRITFFLPILPRSADCCVRGVPNMALIGKCLWSYLHAWRSWSWFFKWRQQGSYAVTSGGQNMQHWYWLKGVSPRSSLL